MPIQYPNRDVNRELARALIEGSIGAVPSIGSGLIAFYRVTHPPAFEALRDAWGEEASAIINSLEERVDRLAPKMILSNEAASLALWIAESSNTGRADVLEFDTVRTAFSDATETEIEDACGELQLESLVEASGALGRRILYLLPQPSLFAVFDPLTSYCTDPFRDAATLGKLLLDDGELNARQALTRLEWTPRRMNPALSVLGELIGDGRKSQTMDPDLECLWMDASPEERVKIKRFVAQIFN